MTEVHRPRAGLPEYALIESEHSGKWNRNKTIEPRSGRSF